MRPTALLLTWIGVCLQAALVLASTCGDFDQYMTIPSHDEQASKYWGLREQMCGNTGCGYQQACELRAKLPSGKYIYLHRWYNYQGVLGFPTCWDVTERIFNNCWSHGNGHETTDNRQYAYLIANS